MPTLSTKISHLRLHREASPTQWSTLRLRGPTSYRNKIGGPQGHGHEWGLRGAAWIDTNVFSEQIDFVDLNITRAVQSSQRPGVGAYHRRVFASRADDLYLIWDSIDTPTSESDCEAATFNLHVLTQLGWPGEVGCTEVTPSASHTTSLECHALGNMTLDVILLMPMDALPRNLLHIEADPLPIQFVGMTGPTGNQTDLGMPGVGGVLGGDWNAAENMPPRVAHYPPRTPTWIRVTGKASSMKEKLSLCSGFLTLLQPRKAGAENKVVISMFEEVRSFSRGSSAVTVQTEVRLGQTSRYNSLYLLGGRPDNDGPQLRGVAAVVGWEVRQEKFSQTRFAGERISAGCR